MDARIPTVIPLKTHWKCSAMSLVFRDSELCITYGQIQIAPNMLIAKTINRIHLLAVISRSLLTRLVSVFSFFP